MQFEREKRNSYMVICCERQLDRNAYKNTVLEHAEIAGFMNYEIREVDGEQTLYYRLRYKTPLSHVLHEIELTYEIVKNMVKSIADIMKQTEEYLLDANYILWSSDYIFMEVGSGKLMFTYYPCERKEKNSLKTFLMELIQFVGKEEKTYLYLMKFYNLVTDPDCDLEEIVQYVGKDGWNPIPFVPLQNSDMKIREENDEEHEKTLSENRKARGKNRKLILIILAVINILVVCLLLFEIWTYQYIWVLMISLILLLIAFFAEYPSEENMTPDEIMDEYLQDYKGNTAEDIIEKNQYNKDLEFAETTVLMNQNQEVVTEDGIREFWLMSMNPKQYKNLIPDKKSTMIGSMKNSCDYVLEEKGISRMHAKILKKEMGLYLLDLNSTNGTYLNEEPVVSGKEYLLEEGDVISIAKVATFAVTEKNEVVK